MTLTSPRTFSALAAAVLGLSATAPARAQLATSLTLSSNLLFRGESVSQDDPTVTLAGSYDGPAGLFVGGDLAVSGGAGAPRMAMAEQYAGIARRLGRVSLEAGVIHRDYGAIYDEAYRLHFFEGYVGLNHRRGRIRFYISPDYLRDGRNTYYLEAEARIARVSGIDLSAHGGLSLIPYDLDSGREGFITYEDWSLAASRKVGRIELGAGIGGTNYPVFGPRGRIRAYASASLAF